MMAVCSIATNNAGDVRPSTARRIAANIAKLPELLTAHGT